MNGPLSAASWTSPTLTLPKPVEVRVEAGGVPAPSRAPRIAAIVVTWNRKDVAASVVGAIGRQDYPLDAIDLVVVDNGSTDGTAEHLQSLFRPERRVENRTDRADRPAFVPGDRTEAAGTNGTANRLGLGSFAVIRNQENLGGCGGFNTGLAFVEHGMEGASEACPDYVWLVDDDVDLPEGALSQLVRTAESDEHIGLVGSRAVDFDDRQTTIETTIFFDAERGTMSPEPPPGHPRERAHREWARAMGGTHGRRAFSGVRDVDIVSACSLLARWSGVRRVGFWDARYFIYCDDADWCLRFGRAGYRVVCDLDAVVYHTNWLAKLTPARAYYAERNILWVMQKFVAPERLRRATLRRLGRLLLHSRKAATHCRLFHAEILRRTAHDFATGRGGRLDAEGPPFIPVMDALARAGALRRDARVLVMCSHPGSIDWADDLRAHVTRALRDRQRTADQPEWIYAVRDGVPDPQASEDGAAAGLLPRRLRFEPNRGSKFRAQRGFLRRPPDAVLVFDQSNDLPLVRSRWNIHIERRRPTMAQIEADGLVPRLRFAARWGITAILCAWRGALLRPRRSAGRYG